MSTIAQEILDTNGKAVGSLELNPAVFAAKVKKDLVRQTVRWQLAKRRAGSASSLTRGEMRGGGKKPFRQKGTGRARAGSNTSPVWVGGGVAHGPHPRSYDFRLTKRARRQALCSVLSHRFSEKRLRVLENIEVESGKTKDMQALLDKLDLKQSKVALLYVEGDQSQQNLVRAGRNIPGLRLLSITGANVYDLLQAKYILASKQALEKLQERLDKDARIEAS